MRIDLAGWTRDATRGDHHAFLRLFEEADRLGFDGVWFNEFRFQTPPEPYPSMMLLAAAVFARTRRLRVGASVLVLPIHDPWLLAEETAQLDRQSGGRLDVGIGRGTRPETLALLGVDPATTRERFETAYEVMLKAWTAGPASGFSAPPCQRPHPPIYVAGTTRETLAFAVERDLPLLLSLEPPEGRQLRTYGELLEGSGRAGALARSSLSRHVVVEPTLEAARSAAGELARSLEERRSAQAATRGAAHQPRRLEEALAQQFVWGDPAQCAAQIEALGRATGVWQLRCVFNGIGALDNALALRRMRLFAEAVAPRLSGLPSEEGAAAGSRM